MLRTGKTFLFLIAVTWALSCILTTLHYNHLLTIANAIIDDNSGWSRKAPRAFLINSINSTTDFSIPVHHVVFLVVGAVRTLEQTQKSIMANVVWPLCSPPSCKAHIVTHLSHADNRPDLSNDPRGKVIGANETIPKTTQFLVGAEDFEWPKKYIQHYTVDKYDIGSASESQAMETYESECSDPEIVRQLRMLRFGDPRRYSMWFARAWAWRYVKQLQHINQIEFDFYSFLRPDLLWFLPVPTREHFRENLRGARDVWVHDRYFSATPDTFAFFPTQAVAESYFAIENIVLPGVACLGGPNFDRELVKKRLAEKGIADANESIWCVSELQGWSEKILQRKLKATNLSPRWLAAGTTILRPQGQLLCLPLHAKHVHAQVTHDRSDFLAAMCLLVSKGRFREYNKVRPFERFHAFRLVEKHAIKTCSKTERTGFLTLVACQEPIPANQIFVQLSSIFLGFDESASRFFEIRTKVMKNKIESSFMEPICNNETQTIRTGTTFSNCCTCK